MSSPLRMSALSAIQKIATIYWDMKCVYKAGKMMEDDVYSRTHHELPLLLSALLGPLQTFSNRVLRQPLGDMKAVNAIRGLSERETLPIDPIDLKHLQVQIRSAAKFVSERQQVCPDIGDITAVVGRLFFDPNVPLSFLGSVELTLSS